MLKAQKSTVFLLVLEQIADLGQQHLLAAGRGRCGRSRRFLFLLAGGKLRDELDKHKDGESDDEEIEGYLQEVKRLISDNQLTGRVEYLGCLKDMELFYKGLDLFVLPSVVKESFGLVLCEAMYCGVPVITTNSGAQEEIITNEVDGVIIEPKDAEVLQNNMENIYRDYDKYLKMADEAKTKVQQKFSVQSCVVNLMKIYNKL